MMIPITHHPDEATLVSYAAATLSEPLAAVVAAHLAMCPRCRSEVADLERLGAALMFADTASPSETPLAPRRRPPDTASFVGKPVQPIDERLPAPLALAYGLAWDEIPWRRLGPGVWHHKLPLCQPAEGDLRLLRIAPGRAMPEHGHGGSELTLVLEGSYSDVTGSYGRGDVQDVDSGVDHQPIVGKEAECICLIASERPARFKSLIGRLTQPWTGL
ncbi:MAG TPA: ChrR family anti-sigma-E factor [Hyphomicrobiaceae bacterium]|nr:ChrR family anti-sigma-E factor [Hyphomicrobiaceae bacterium]